MSGYGKAWDIPEPTDPPVLFKGPDGCDWDTGHVAEYIGSLLGFCGCGMPEACLRWLRDMLSEIASRSEAWRRGAGQGYILSPMEHLPDPVQYLLWYWMDDHELTEHGGNVTGSWLTERGSELLERLKGMDLEGI